MSWITVGVAAAGAVSGTIAGNKNRKRQKELDQFRKTSIAYSPWSGMGDPGAMNAGPQGMDATLQGGMQGAMIGNSMSGLDFSGGAAKGAMNTDVMQGASQNALGGQTMAADLGSSFKNSSAMPMSAGVGNVDQGFAMPAMGGMQQAASPTIGGGSSWDLLKQRTKSMDPTASLYAGMYPQSGAGM